MESKGGGWAFAAKLAGAAAGAAYGVALAALWANQEKILFKPDPFSRADQSLRARRGARAKGRRVMEWAYKAPDGASIQGYVSLPGLRVGSSGASLAAVVYFGGIREESSWALEHAWEFGEKAFVCVNYRGYGLSEGRPEQEKILADCAGAMEMLASQGYFDPAKVHVIGRSLGSGVAGYLSNKMPVAKVCLVTPYDSVLSVAKRKYWFLPVGSIIRHPFDAMPWARKNAAPMLMILSERDEVVPHQHSQRLYEAWSGEKSQIMISGVDHSTVVLADNFFKTIAAFFEPAEKSAREDGSRGEGVGVDAGAIGGAREQARA